MPWQNPNKKKITLGLTGAFGSGKTTVAGIFASLGAEIIDADKIAHRLIQPGSRVYKKIVAVFGRSILKKNRTVDRRKLGRLVFSNKARLKELNAIIHPEVIRIIKKKIKQARAGIVVIDAPLLLEVGLKKMVDKLIVVKITRDRQIKRVQDKMRLSKNEILKRAGFQIPLEAKARLADFIIDNNGRLEKTRKQVVQIRRSLWKN